MTLDYRFSDPSEPTITMGLDLQISVVSVNSWAAVTDALLEVGSKPWIFAQTEISAAKASP